MKFMLWALMLIVIALFEGLAVIGAQDNPVGITEFSSDTDGINYDSYAQGPTVFVRVQWALENAPLGTTLAFAQVQSNGDRLALPIRDLSPLIDVPLVTANQAYLEVCVGGAGCEFNGQIQLIMSLVDANGTMIASRDLSIPIHAYSMARENDDPLPTNGSALANFIAFLWRLWVSLLPSID